jgi:hypothetical protein
MKNIKKILLVCSLFLFSINSVFAVGLNSVAEIVQNKSSEDSSEIKIQDEILFQDEINQLEDKIENQTEITLNSQENIEDKKIKQRIDRKIFPQKVKIFEIQADQRKSQFSFSIQEIIKIGKSNKEIGQQIEVLVQDQELNYQQIESSLKKINNRNKIIKFFIGFDYQEVKKTQQSLNQNKKNLEVLQNLIKTEIKKETDFNNLLNQTTILKEINIEIEKSLKDLILTFSLFGWLFK